MTTIETWWVAARDQLAATAHITAGQASLCLAVALGLLLLWLGSLWSRRKYFRFLAAGYRTAGEAHRRQPSRRVLAKDRRPR